MPTTDPSSRDAYVVDFFTLPSPLWPAVRQLRHDVFVIEQKVPIELEQDEADSTALHLAIRQGHDVLGTLRILKADRSAKIGRVAVAASHRRRGLARRMLRHAIAHCTEAGLSTIALHAQTESRALYDGLGFRPMGTIFLEAGISHIRMELPIGTR